MGVAGILRVDMVRITKEHVPTARSNLQKTAVSTKKKMGNGESSHPIKHVARVQDEAFHAIVGGQLESEDQPTHSISREKNRNGCARKTEEKEPPQKTVISLLI